MDSANRAGKTSGEDLVTGMIILSDVQTLELTLAATVATNQLDFVASFIDVDENDITADNLETVSGVSNNTTAVTVVGSPASGIVRQIKSVTVNNLDTAVADVIIRLNDNGAIRKIVKQSVAIDGTLQFIDAEGWSLVS